MKNSEYSKIIAECEHQPILDEIKGDYICSKCGLVIERHYVVSKYQMNDNLESDMNNNSRFMSLGTRLNMVDGLGSFIGFQHANKFRDKYGKILSGSNQTLFKRLKYRYDLRARINNNETDYRILNILNRIISILNLSNNIRDRAAYYYRKITKQVSKENMTNHVILIALCMFLAIREYNEKAPVTIQEIAETFKTLHYRVSARTIIREAIKIKPYVGDLFTHQTRNSEDYINRIISEVINSNEVIDRLDKNNINHDQYQIFLKKKSRELLNQIKLKKRGGRNPYIFAVATVYTADRIFRKNKGCRSILTQKILSNITDCAEYSIRDHYRFIKNDYLN